MAGVLFDRDLDLRHALGKSMMVYCFKGRGVCFLCL